MAGIPERGGSPKRSPPRIPVPPPNPTNPSSFPSTTDDGIHEQPSPAANPLPDGCRIHTVLVDWMK